MDANVLCDQVLDKLGYDKATTNRRTEVNTKISHSMNMMTHETLGNTHVDKILVGSRREGLSLYGESDTDVMFILNDVMSVETSILSEATTTDKLQLNQSQTSVSQEGVANQKTLLLMDTINAPAGYTILKIDESSISNEYIDCATVTTPHGTLLSSTAFLAANKDKFRLYQGWMKQETQYATRNGPSLPEFISQNSLFRKILKGFKCLYDVSNEKDCVPAIPCICPSLKQDWQDRIHPGNWPTLATIHHAAKLPVYVVPVGKKGSIHEDQQWRISFTLAEIHLVQTFDDTQLKTLVLLRMIAKVKLRPISSKISSYVMKNVSFWLAESCPTKSLLEQVKHGLILLRDYVCLKNLPCYMLQQRNLLEALTEDEAQKLVQTIDSVILHERLGHCMLNITQQLQQNKLDKCAVLDRISLEMFKELNPSEIARIILENAKCTTSLGQQMCYIRLLLTPYIQKHGFSKLLKCARTSQNAPIAEETRDLITNTEGSANNQLQKENPDLEKIPHVEEKIQPRQSLEGNLVAKDRKSEQTYSVLINLKNLALLMLIACSAIVYSITIFQILHLEQNTATTVNDFDVYLHYVKILYFQNFLFKTLEKYGYFELLQQFIMILQNQLIPTYQNLLACLTMFLDLRAFTGPEMIWHLTKNNCTVSTMIVFIKASFTNHSQF